MLKSTTEQETFDLVVNHLLTQNERAVIEGKCRYRLGSLKCAVGCLIPDTLYTEDMEERSVGPLLDKFPHLRNVVAINHHDHLLNGLQGVHDDFEPVNWPLRLRNVALCFGLNTFAIDNHPRVKTP